MIFKGAATPSSVVNFSIRSHFRLEAGRWFIANTARDKGPLAQG
jgi:hypothetical protein